MGAARGQDWGQLAGTGVLGTFVGAGQCPACPSGSFRARSCPELGGKRGRAGQRALAREGGTAARIRGPGQRGRLRPAHPCGPAVCSPRLDRSN